MTALVAPPDWYGPSAVPADEQFADVVEPATPESAGDYRAVLVGERLGAADGPNALRDALAPLRTHHLERGAVGPLGDLGTVAVPDAEPGVAAVRAATRDFAARVHRTDALPVFLGGDGTLTYANAAPLLDRGSLGVVSFDAHLDCRDADGGSRHRTAPRRLLEDGLDALAVVGARHFGPAGAHHEYVRERGGRVVSPRRVAEAPVDALTDALAPLEGVDAVYASLDLDVLDAASPGGLAAPDLFRMLDRLALDDRLAGFEVVGDATPPDASGRIAAAGARAVAHALSGLGVER